MYFPNPRLPDVATPVKWREHRKRWRILNGPGAALLVWSGLSPASGLPERDPACSGCWVSGVPLPMCWVGRTVTLPLQSYHGSGRGVVEGSQGRLSPEAHAGLLTCPGWPVRMAQLLALPGRWPGGGICCSQACPAPERPLPREVVTDDAFVSPVEHPDPTLGHERHHSVYQGHSCWP